MARKGSASVCVVLLQGQYDDHDQSPAALGPGQRESMSAHGHRRPTRYLHRARMCNASVACLCILHTSRLKLQHSLVSFTVRVPSSVSPMAVT